jgi:hypothetical protein
MAPSSEGSVNQAPITLTIDRDDLATVEGLLLKAKATELSDLRRAQTQLSVYGERRAGMEGEPPAISRRLDVLADLLGQLERQR